MNPPTVIQNDDGKHLATVIAKLAIKGFQVHPLVTGGWFVACPHMTKFCPALSDLEHFEAIQ